MSLNRHYTVRCDGCGESSGLRQQRTPYRARRSAQWHGWGRVPVPDNHPCYDGRAKYIDLCPMCLLERKKGVEV